jgi:hypothetical protein
MHASDGRYQGPAHALLVLRGEMPKLRLQESQLMQPQMTWLNGEQWRGEVAQGTNHNVRGLHS